MAGLGDGLLDRFTEGAIPAGIVEHIEVGGGTKEGFWGLILLFLFPFLLSLFDDDPLRVAGQGVELELERAGSARRQRGRRRTHLSDGDAPGEAAR